MQIPQDYFQDKLALALSSVSLLAVICTIALSLTRILGGNTASFIVAYRANLGIEAFKSGGLAGILSLMIFAVVALVIQTVLCWRTYIIKRHLAITVLVAGLFLILLDLVVINALLALH